MDTKKILTLIQDPRKLDAEAVQGLKRLLPKYPYYQLACVLIAKKQYDQAPEAAQAAVQLAAIYTTDRNQLRRLLEGDLFCADLVAQPKIPETVPQKAHQILAANKKNKAENTASDYINSYISTLQQQEEKAINKKKSLEQHCIIENFIKNKRNFKPLTLQEMSWNEANIDLTQDSVVLQEALFTESLAKAMLAQGKFERAIEIYGKLQSRFPEKEKYFLTLKEKIKNEI